MPAKRNRKCNTIIKDEPEEDICALCLDRLCDPVQLLCKHPFCRSCLALYLEERAWQAKSCPLCRRSLKGDSSLKQIFKATWRMKIELLLALLLLSLGTFYLLLIYW